MIFRSPVSAGRSWLAASVTAILARPAPLKLAVLVAVVAGVAAAMLVELARERRTAR